MYLIISNVFRLAIKWVELLGEYFAAIPSFETPMLGPLLAIFAKERP